jgi:hypothetical protein
VAVTVATTSVVSGQESATASVVPVNRHDTTPASTAPRRIGTSVTNPPACSQIDAGGNVE